MVIELVEAKKDGGYLLCSNSVVYFECRDG